MKQKINLKMRTGRHVKPQLRGFSLIELMVALAIGTLIVLAVGTLFAHNNKNFTVQNSLAHMNENSVSALEFMASKIRLAGYHNRSQIDSSMADLFPDMAVASLSPNFRAGELVRVVPGTTDTIVVRMYADGTSLAASGSDRSVLDCKGNPADKNSMIVIRLSLSPTKDLLCSDWIATTTSAASGAVTVTGIAPGNVDLQVASNIDNMRFLLGVDTSKGATNPPAATAYWTPASVTAVYRPYIQAVKMCITSRSRIDKMTTTNTAMSYLDCTNALAGNLSTPTTATDTRLYRSFVQSVGLRNMAVTQ